MFLKLRILLILNKEAQTFDTLMAKLKFKYNGVNDVKLFKSLETLVGKKYITENNYGDVVFEYSLAYKEVIREYIASLFNTPMLWIGFVGGVLAIFEFIKSHI